jgi:hypothetical protein
MLSILIGTTHAGVPKVIVGPEVSPPEVVKRYKAMTTSRKNPEFRRVALYSLANADRYVTFDPENSKQATAPLKAEPETQTQKKGPSK